MKNNSTEKKKGGVTLTRARPESLLGLLLVRNALSGKGESRQVTGNHREPSPPSPTDSVPPLQASLTPPGVKVKCEPPEGRRKCNTAAWGPPERRDTLPNVSALKCWADCLAASGAQAVPVAEWRETCEDNFFFFNEKLRMQEDWVWEKRTGLKVECNGTATALPSGLEFQTVLSITTRSSPTSTLERKPRAPATPERGRY